MRGLALATLLVLAATAVVPAQANKNPIVKEIPFACDSSRSGGVISQFVNTKQKLALEIRSASGSSDTEYAGATFSGIAGQLPNLVLNVSGDPNFLRNAGMYVSVTMPYTNPNMGVYFIPFSEMQFVGINPDGTYQVKCYNWDGECNYPFTFNSAQIVGFGGAAYTGYVYDVYVDPIDCLQLQKARIVKVTGASIKSCDLLPPLSNPSQLP
jgi:hypothetical protein